MQTLRRSGSAKSVVVAAVFSVLLMMKPMLGQTGEGESWKDWQIKGNQFMEESEVEEACKAFRQALTVAIRSHALPTDMLHIHTSLGAAYAVSGRFVEAETEFRSALGLDKVIHGTDSLEYAMDYAALLLLPTYTGEHDSGIPLLKIAVARHDSNGDVAELLTAKDYLSKLLFSEGRISEAEGVLVEAQAEYERSGLVDAWTEGELLNDLSVVRDKEGLYKDAAHLDQETIALLEKRFGKESSGLVAPLNNLATMYARMGRYEESEDVFARAADLCKKTMGTEHPLYGQLLQNQAVVLRRLGKKKESRAVRAKSEEAIHESNRVNGVGATVDVNALRAQR